MEERPLVQACQRSLTPMVVLPTAYFGPVSYYAALYHSDEVVIEACEHYVKQTLRNRTVIATGQGPQTLSAYVEKGNRAKMPVSEVRLSPHNDWPRQHLYSLATYYGMSPFFEYYADDLREVLLHGHDGTLLGMNEALRRFVCREIGFEPNVRLSTEWMGPVADQNAASWSALVGPRLEAKPYYQIAAVQGQRAFEPDMSILDLLFNMGPESILVLADSFTKSNNPQIATKQSEL